LVGGVNTTKELNDASFKMPKVMKDMAYKIVALSPGIKHTLLVITGVYIGEDKLKLVTLDFPRGYNARYDAFDPVIYPMSESKTRRRLARVLKMVIDGRLIRRTPRRSLMMIILTFFWAKIDRWIWCLVLSQLLLIT